MSSLYDSLEGTNILIAGSAGFVPSHVAELYLNKGAVVYGLDNFITGSESNVELLSKYSNYHFEECNIYKSLPDFKEIKFDYILSLASPASPIDFKVIPIEIMLVNSEGTRALLNLAKEHHAVFLEASTSEVYGDPEVHPQVESYFGNVNPVGERSVYDESKRYAEAMTMAYKRLYNLDSRIIRIFNTYGPRMRPDDGRVIPNFVNQAIRGEDITIYGDGSQTRSFCFVSDLCEAISYVLIRGDHNPYNIGNPEEYRIKDCAKIITEILNSKSEMSYKPLPEDDPKRRRPNISRVTALGYSPTIDFQEGLELTAKYFTSLI